MTKSKFIVVEHNAKKARLHWDLRFETPKKKNYFYLDKALCREVVFINTTVWGGHDRFAEIHGGQLTLQQMTCKRIFEGVGSGFEVSSGSLDLVNCFFNDPGEIIIPGKDMGIVNTKGNIFYREC